MSKIKQRMNQVDMFVMRRVGKEIDFDVCVFVMKQIRNRFFDEYISRREERSRERERKK